MEAPDLRDAIQQAVGDALGSYRFVNQQGNPIGPVAPAISILDSGEAVPNNRRVSGLEIVIRKHPNRTPRPCFGGHQEVKSWQVFLVQWVEGPDTMAIALSRMTAAFPLLRSQTLGTSEQKNVKEQVGILISDVTEFVPNPDY